MIMRDYDIQELLDFLDGWAMDDVELNGYICDVISALESLLYAMQRKDDSEGREDYEDRE